MSFLHRGEIYSSLFFLDSRLRGSDENGINQSFVELSPECADGLAGLVGSLGFANIRGAHAKFFLKQAAEMGGIAETALIADIGNTEVIQVAVAEDVFGQLKPVMANQS